MAYPGAGNAESFIKVRGLGWDSAISGKIRADEGLLAGSSIDLNDTLGITDSTVVPEIEGKIGFLGTSRFIIAYSPASYEGRKRSYQQLNFGGKTFVGGGEMLDTQLDISVASVLYEFAPLPEGVAQPVTSGEPEMGVLLGLKYFHTEAQITSNSTGLVANKTFGLPIPVVGLRIQGRLAENMQLESAGTWMSLKTKDADLYWSDLYGELKLSVVPKIPFGIGYKLTRLTVKSDMGQSFLSRFGFKGWYLMASIEL
ncbi:MAG TPA: hypothetical protein VJC37_01560 [Planctomycetota bacterium]|nr:hypothetical protein [Planctomycetota bacterium]